MSSIPCTLPADIQLNDYVMVLEISLWRMHGWTSFSAMFTVCTFWYFYILYFSFTKGWLYVETSVKALLTKTICQKTFCFLWCIVRKFNRLCGLRLFLVGLVCVLAGLFSPPDPFFAYACNKLIPSKMEGEVPIRPENTADYSSNHVHSWTHRRKTHHWVVGMLHWNQLYVLEQGRLERKEEHNLPFIWLVRTLDGAGC